MPFLLEICLDHDCYPDFVSLCITILFISAITETPRSHIEIIQSSIIRFLSSIINKTTSKLGVHPEKLVQIMAPLNKEMNNINIFSDKWISRGFLIYRSLAFIACIPALFHAFIGNTNQVGIYNMYIVIPILILILILILITIINIGRIIIEHCKFLIFMHYSHATEVNNNKKEVDEFLDTKLKRP